jgi:2-desacetyl-2-hydroxyethyl bacteriochlorophyllide A dehydrogenase
MKEKFKAVWLEKPNDFSVKSVSIQKPQGYLTVKPIISSICGSDIKIFSGKMKGISYPFIPGHEWVGIVVEAPSGFGHLLGKRVVPDILGNCGICSYCNKLLPNLCKTLEEPGINTHGGFGEVCYIRPDKVYLINDSISNEEATLIEPLAVALYALKRVPVHEDDIIMIIGGGGIGQMIAQACLLRNPKSILLIDHHDFRLDLAKKQGVEITINPNSVDIYSFFSKNPSLSPSIVYEVTGTHSGIDLAFNIIKKAGTIGIVGYSGDEKYELSTAEIMVRLLNITGVLSPTGTIPKSIEYVLNKHVNLLPLLTHLYKLNDFSQAFEKMSNHKKECLRVAVEIR